MAIYFAQNDRYLTEVESRTGKPQEIRLLACRMYVLNPLRLSSYSALTFEASTHPQTDERGNLFVYIIEVIQRDQAQRICLRDFDYWKETPARMDPAQTIQVRQNLEWLVMLTQRVLETISIICLSLAATIVCVRTFAEIAPEASLRCDRPQSCDGANSRECFANRNSKTFAI